MRVPEINILLWTQPHLGLRTKRARQAVRHVSRDWPALMQYLANSSWRDAKQAREFILR